MGPSQPSKKALGAEQPQWRFINAALKSGVAKGVFTKNGGKYKVVKVKAAPKKKKKATKKKEKENQKKESHQKESNQKESQKKEDHQKKEKIQKKNKCLLLSNVRPNKGRTS